MCVRVLWFYNLLNLQKNNQIEQIIGAKFISHFSL